jgi:glycosyltransferase involved in cell wall biosynthesis
MRLAVFTSKYPSRVSTFFERDMRALLEAGIEVDVLPIYPLDPDLWRHSSGVLGEDVLPRDRVHHLSAFDGMARLRPWPPRQAARFLGDAAAALRPAARYGPGVVARTAYVLPKAWAWACEHADRYDHVLGYWGNYAATCAYLFHRLVDRPIPFSIWLHAGTDLYLRRPFLREKLLYADCIVTCCEFNRRFLREQYPELVPAIDSRIHVVYHGLDLAAFPYEPRGRPPGRVLGVGRLARHKGWEYLLRAVAELQRRGVPAEVELVGGGECREELTRLGAELGIGPRLSIRGWVPFEEVRRAMSQATVLVHPSEGLGDGLPNVIREAMALGTPVIASDIAGIPEALDRGRCGMLVPPRDVAALSAAIERLLGDEELRLRLAANARALTETKFDLWRNGSALAERLRAARRGASRQGDAA